MAVMSVPPVAHAAQIRDLSGQLMRSFGRLVFERGKAYAHAGRVESLSATAGGGLQSQVLGSSQTPYEQSIRITRRPDGKLASVSSTCTCPLRTNCKHVVAAILRAAEQGLVIAGGPPSPPPKAQPIVKKKPPAPALTGDVAFWFKTLELAAEAGQSVRESYPADVRERLLYVLRIEKPNHYPPFAIATLQGVANKEGVLARAAVPFFMPGKTPDYVLDVDKRIIKRIGRIGLTTERYNNYGAQEPLRGEVLALLQDIAATGRGYLGSIVGPALLAGSRREGVFAWAPAEDGSQHPVLQDPAGAPLTLLLADPLIWVDPASGAFGPLTLEVPDAMAKAFLAGPPIAPEDTMAVAAQFRVLASSAGAPALPAPVVMDVERRQGVKPTPVLTLLPISGVVNRLDYSLMGRSGYYYRPGKRAEAVTCPGLRLSFDYQGHILPLQAKGDHRFEEGGRTVLLSRDDIAESAAIEHLGATGATTLGAMGDVKKIKGAQVGDFVLPHASLMADEQSPSRVGRAHPVFTTADLFAFMDDDIADLRAAGWRVEIAADWPWRLHEGPVKIHAGASGEVRGADWFSLGLTLEADGETLDLAEIIISIIEALPVDEHGAIPADLDLDALLEDMILHKRLGNGTFVALDAEQLIPLVRVFLASRSLFEGFHLGESGRLPDVAEALAGCGVPFEGGLALLDLGARLRALTLQPLAEPPAPLRATLRAYQKTGYGWLRALAETGFGGVLADDMGLGKTIQTLALLLDRHVVRSADRPSLLIIPTSLVGLWRREAERFAPDLKVLILHGGERHEHFDKIDDAHLVITTYPLLLRDHARLLAREWDLAILDEAQAVKNTSTAGAKHIRGVKARARIALTGTPMENNLEEFWALFDWLVPGLLGDRKGFNARFRTPIEKGGSLAAQEALNARVRPFLLRRTKDMVAADLPEKTIITETVTLGDKQRALYETIRLSMDARVREAIAAKGFGASRITILSALLKLRQVCCDPALLASPEAEKIKESAKRSRLMELLGDLIAEGRRVVVFSQFVSMLELIRSDIEERGWDHAWLTGDTRDRDGAVSRFQQGKTPVFLISLKAGGVGLTLTAADTVILYDPWWNPAVERQAMDRVHRIGQNRAVFVYRLVAEGAVEESILALQDRKQALADALFEGKSGSPLGLDEADIAQLFRPLA